MKIAVIGYSGSGKSTLAGKLGRLYNCPVLYLDTIQFEAGWKERDVESAINMVKKFMDENNKWVIDGNYTKFLRAKRLDEADKIIFLNFSRWTCFYQAYKRYCNYKGKTRESMAEGCDEKLDYEFIKWILCDGRSMERKRQYADTIRKYGPKTAVLKNRVQVEVFLQELQQNKIMEEKYGSNSEG